MGKQWGLGPPPCRAPTDHRPHSHRRRLQAEKARNRRSMESRVHLSNSSSTHVVCVYTYVSEVKVAQSCPTLCNPMNYTVHELSRPEYWSRQPFPSPGDLPDPRIEPASPVSPALAGGCPTPESPGKPTCCESNEVKS